MSVQPGTHVAVAKQFDLGTSNNGNKFIRVVFEIADGPAQGRELSWWGYFTKATAERTLQALRYCGWSGEKIDEDMAGLGQYKVDIVVSEEEYDGKTRKRIQWVNRRGSGPRPAEQQLKDDDFAQLNAALGNHLNRSEALKDGETVSEFQQAGRLTAATTEDTSDDIPF